MADRILAAMEYLDAHSKLMPQKLKQRALGDIDGKYSVVDPLLEISYYPSIKNDVTLTGVKKTNPTNDRSSEEIVNEDRERLMLSAERAKSAPAPYKDTPVLSSGRPMTSSSWVTGSYGTRDDDRHLHHSLLTSASHASIKRLSFTSPTVNVGPADVRDEIMDEIVSKPLVFQRNGFKSQSAPPGGRITSSVLKSAGTRGTRWTSTPKRARTSLRRRRNGANSYQKNAGPFMTVKVSEKELWVVSNSTPTSYFENNDDGLREASGMNGTKVPKWEDTAESVPKPDQISPPKHERLLGAPAQFAPTIQWLRYDHSSPPKKPPVLAPYKDSSDEKKYYNMETTQSNKVSQHLNASPGVRIARNGAVLSRSMLLGNFNDSDHEFDKESESDGSDVDVASLIPSKLAGKIKKHYGTPENDEESEKDDSDEEDRHQVVNEHKDDDSDSDDSSDEEADSEKDEPAEMEQKDDNDSDAASELSLISNENTDDEEQDKREALDNPKPLLTQSSLALLTRLSGHATTNPMIDSSNESATSFESLESYELNHLIEHGIKNGEVTRITNGHSSEQDDVWRVLESGTPNLWITKSKQQKLTMLKRIRRHRKSEQLISGRESLKSSKTKEDVEEVILPLCWNDEMNKTNSRIVHGATGTVAPSEQNGNTTLPVVFHKVLRYDRLPTTSPLKPTISFARERPRSAYSQTIEGTFYSVKPSRGYRAPVSTPRSNRSVRTKSASTVSSRSSATVRGHSAPHSIINGTEIIRQSIDLADLLRVTPDSFPAKSQQFTTRAHFVKKEHVTIVHDDVSEKEMQSVREEADITLNGRAHESADLSSKTNSARGHNAEETKYNRIQAPVDVLNLSGIDTDNTTNGTTTFSSQRLSDLRISSLGTSQNTPRTPMTHHSILLTPKTSARHHSGTIRMPVAIEEESAKTGDGYQDGISFNSKHASVVAQDYHNGGVTSVPIGGRSKGGFASNPLTHNRLKSGSTRGLAPHFSGTASQYSSIKPMKAFPNMQPGMVNGGTDLASSIPAVQIGQNFTSGPQINTADFIQITQSLHISDRTDSEIPTTTGNKMYDSYMRELSAHHSPETDERGEQKSIILGRSLGGTSGKPSVFSLARSVKKNLSNYRPPSQQNQSPNISPFTPHAGRRSGLTMVPQESNQFSQKVGSFGLGVKGDQVRLNIDKNIHNIYRDLGLLKAPDMGQKIDQHLPSPGRSHVSSAKSRATLQDESVISIPTASEPSVVNVPIKNAKERVSENNVQAANTNGRPSSSNPSVVVHDSGTQWSGRNVKFDESEVNGNSTEDSQLTNESHNTEPSSLLKQEEPKSSDQITNNIEKESIRSENVDSAHGDSRSPTSDRSLARGISRNSDAVSMSESSRSLHSPPVHFRGRSASETLLDRLAELGDRDGTSDSAEEEEEIDEREDVVVKGVTRVTVTPVKTDPVS